MKMTLILQGKGSFFYVEYILRINMTPGHYSTGFIILVYTGSSIRPFLFFFLHSPFFDLHVTIDFNIM